MHMLTRQAVQVYTVTNGLQFLKKMLVGVFFCKGSILYSGGFLSVSSISSSDTFTCFCLFVCFGFFLEGGGGGGYLNFFKNILVQSLLLLT